MSRAAIVKHPALTGMAELMAMLSMRRPAWSKTERSFIKRFIRPLGMQEDAFGNLYKRIGTAPILWSSHTDTVHHSGGTQLLSLRSGVVTQADKQSNCLGADCTAGVWLMAEMIRAGREGLYVFHRAEEIGGKGSSFIAHDTPALLDGILYAVAFDRRGTHSVITHQGARCCSESFSASLGLALGMGHSSDSGGTFTDTANYVDLIGECSNLSVGYAHEHTKRESLDVAYLMALRDALVALDPAVLVSERKPGEADPDDWQFNWEDDEDQEPRHGYSGTLTMLVRDHPDEVADWLEEYGITADELETALWMRGCVVRK
jgi:hypothetical protein